MDELKPYIELIEMKQFPNSSYMKLERGWGNGYVHLPPGHRWHGQHYEKIPVEVHGGLTYSQWDKEQINWIIGFDTSHYSDTLERWPKEAVEAETNNLLKQCL